jgi:dihydrofolate synthase/folylpolyglutamate synthase
MTARSYLRKLELHGVKLGLDTITQLLDAAGKPHHHYPAVHIAGTNGKGSVAAMVDAILGAAGYRVGRFTSPHLIDLRERFKCGDKLISDEELDSQIARFRGIAEGIDVTPTYFELVTAVALAWFAEMEVDLAIVEVGMGGRFDSTNVVQPMACAITSIGLDHTRYLGETVEAIAFEKAGIIKPAVPVITTEGKAACYSVIAERAEELGSAVQLIGRDFQGSVSGDPFNLEFSFESVACAFGPTRLGLNGSYQGENAAAAVALALEVSKSFSPLDDGAIIQGLAQAHWPCRLEEVLRDPRVIIDVAHNPAGAQLLSEQLPPCAIILAVSSDKDAVAMVEALSPITAHLILAEFEGARAASVGGLSRAIAPRPHECCGSLAAAIARGVGLAEEGRPLLITGSIFAAGQARDILAAQYGAAPLRF